MLISQPFHCWGKWVHTFIPNWVGLFNLPFKYYFLLAYAHVPSQKFVLHGFICLYMSFICLNFPFSNLSYSLLHLALCGCKPRSTRLSAASSNLPLSVPLYCACYGMNCVPPKFMSKPNSQCDGIWKWGLWQIIRFRWRHEGGAPKTWLVLL